jgi:hypothetical protein
MNYNIQLESFFQGQLKWDRRRIKFLVSFIVALIKVKTVNLVQIALGLNPNATSDSNYRRIQRFLQKFEVEMDCISKVIVALLPLHKDFVLTLDRTNWKFGQININVLVLGIAYKGTAFPVMWKFLPKRGNSHTNERIELMEKFIALYGIEKIKCLTADREFIGKDWFTYLRKRKIPFCIRIKNNSQTNRGVRVDRLFHFLDVNECYIFPRKRQVMGHKLFIVGVKLIDEYLIIVTPENPEEALENYKKRWEIETLFSSLKKTGFNFEDTHLVHGERIEKLFALMAIAFCWAHLVGEWLNEIKPLKVKKHRRLQKSIFRYGLDYMRSILLNIQDKSHEFFMIVRILSCT